MHPQQFLRMSATIIGLLFASLMLAGESIALGQSNVLVANYVGPKTIHLSYYQSDLCLSHHCIYRLWGTSVDGIMQELASTTFSRGEIVFSDTMKYADLPPQLYLFLITRTSYNAANEQTEHSILQRMEVQVTGDTAAGGLLFDESWSGNVACGGVYVPAGKTLTVDAQLADLPSSSCVINVAGTLDLGSNVDIRNAHVILAAPHHFTNLDQALITFAEGSGGSSISSSSNLYLIVAAPMTISNIQGLHLSIDSPNGTVSVANVTGLQMSSILIEDGDVVQVSNVEWGATTSIQGDGIVDINEVYTTNDISLTVFGRTYVSIQNSVFNNLRIVGSAADWEIADNEFNGNLTMDSNVGASIHGNVFVGAITFSSGWCAFGSQSMPNIRNNSFIGERALVVESPRYWRCEQPIAIGPNYYGDANGPVIPYISQYRSFLKHRGASVDQPLEGTPFFRLAEPLPTGEFRDNRATPPQFWVNGYRIGQSLLLGEMSELIKGKETLVTIDLATSEHTVNGVKVYAIFDGMTISPTRGDSLTLHRDLAQYQKGIGVERGLSTVNFILPPVTQDTASLQVMLDLSGISSYPVTQTSFELINRTLHFNPPPARRPLSIAVAPVQLPEGVASATETAAVVKTLLPAMMPILPDQVQVQIWPVVQERSYWTRMGLLNSLATNLALRQAFLNDYATRYRYPRDHIDFIVAVLPPGVLGEDVYGASMRLRRGVIFVDQAHPEAVIHEMGHALGLYTLVEQYNIPWYKPVGMPLQDATVFLGAPATASRRINGHFAYCDSQRICHVPTYGMWWSSDTHSEWYDVMGVVKGELREWPAAATINTFSSFFASLEPLTASAGSGASVNHSADLAQLDGRDLVFSAQLELFETEGDIGNYVWAPCLAWRVLPDTIRLAALASPTSGVATAQAMDRDGGSATLTNTLPRCISAAHPLYLIAYDAAGQLISGSMIGRFPSPPDTVRAYEVSMEIGNIPAHAARVEIREGNMNGRLLATFTAAVSLPPPRITTLIDGANLAPSGLVTSTIMLNWVVSGSLATVASSQPLQYLVEYSRDQGVTWQPLDAPFEQTTLAIPISALPMSDNLTLRVTASNGITASSTQVSGLRRPNLRPLVTISAPADGAQAMVGTRWTLQASAYDFEDGTPLQGTWRTLTGTIGVGPVLADVVLPVGRHTLTYEVVDRQGGRASASVTVSVVAAPVVDLAFAPAALQVYAPQWSGSDPEALYLTQGVTNTMGLQLPAVSREVTATATLYLTPPNGSEIVLLSRQVQLQPLQTAAITVQYLPPTAGTYTFRAVLSDVTPGDANPGNNQTSWRLTAIRPPAIAVAPASPLTIRAAVGFSQSVPVSLTNTGAAPLFIADLQFTGADAGRLFVTQDTCRFTEVQPGASCTLHVRFHPAVIGEATAVLQITSTDPQQPVVERVINGIGIEPHRVYVPMIRRSNPYP